MPNVRIHENPVIAKIGTDASNITTIETSLGVPGTSPAERAAGVVTIYQINNRITNETITIRSDANRANEENITRLDTGSLNIRLESRTKYQARARTLDQDFGPWVNFTTRDKRYQSPDAITKLTDNSDFSAATTGIRYDGEPMGGNREIIVTNNARATETDNAKPSFATGNRQVRLWGAVTVVNTDPIHADVVLQSGREQLEFGVVNSKKLGKNKVPVRYTARGATIVTDNTIQFTNRGATIDSTKIVGQGA